jgi:hypothetical protein
MSKKKILQFPILLECCQLTQDKFWQSVFEDLAYGIGPHGTYISNSMLCCNFKRKSFMYDLRNKNAHTLFTEISELLKLKLELKSEMDRKIDNTNIQDALEKIKSHNTTWNSIKKKNIKELIINMFVSNMKQTYSLNNKQTTELLTYINMAIVFKTLSSDDIHYENGQIIKIKGIKFDQHIVIYEKSLYNSVDNSKICKSDFTSKKKSLNEDWDKYLKEMGKLVK